MDGELLSRVRTVDEEALVMLVARCQQPVLRLACSMVPNQQVAEQAVTDMWLGVVRGNERFEGRASLKTWLFKIRVNRARSAGSRVPTDPSIETIHAVDATRLDAAIEKT
jgi:RNA polymerase sigma-70 factor (ECF subfamily)